MTDGWPTQSAATGLPDTSVSVAVVHIMFTEVAMPSLNTPILQDNRNRMQKSLSKYYEIRLLI